VIKQSELPWSSIARELIGKDQGGISLCIIWFTNTGDGNLRQIDIHASPRFATEWLAASET
jgi:hypothetical protein